MNKLIVCFFAVVISLTSATSNAFASVYMGDITTDILYDNNATNPNTIYGESFISVRANLTATTVRAYGSIEKFSTDPTVPDIVKATGVEQFGVSTTTVTQRLRTSKFVLEPDSDYAFVVPVFWDDHGRWMLAGEGYFFFNTKTDGEEPGEEG